MPSGSQHAITMDLSKIIKKKIGFKGLCYLNISHSTVIDVLTSLLLAHYILCKPVGCLYNWDIQCHYISKGTLHSL